MAGLFSILNTGKTSLNAHQIGISTVSHNISNVNTPGYSKQTATFENRDPFMTRNGQIGRGVDILTVDRANTNFVNRQIIDNNAKTNYFDQGQSLLSEVENVFQDSTNGDIQNSMVDFFDSFKTLSTRPDDPALRENVRKKGEEVINSFSRIYSKLESIQRQLNPEIEQNINKINDLTEEISKLNKEIASEEFAGHQANDLRDRQELKIKELAKIVKVNTFKDNKGFTNVWMDSGEPLVSGKQAYKMSIISQPNGLHHIGVNHGGVLVDVTSDLRGGKLASIIDVRDNSIESYKTKLDSLANQFATQVNTIHNSGYGLDLVHRDFFQQIDTTSPFSAKNMQINTAIQTNLDAIAAGQINDPNSIHGDNRNAIAISDLMENTTFFGSGETFADYYQHTVANVGHDVKNMQNNFEYSKEEQSQLKAFRKSIAGVNTDEELINLNKFKKAYEASSRIITTAQDMLDTILNLKR